jgi:acyl carrier protein
MEVAQPQGREARIRSILEAIFLDLSGVDVSASGSTPFLELGFDSLFLTQVSQALHEKFGLKITFRQLLDQLSNLEALAAHVDQNLAPDALSEPESPRPASQPEASIAAVNAASSAFLSSTAGDGSAGTPRARRA